MKNIVHHPSVLKIFVIYVDPNQLTMYSFSMAREHTFESNHELKQEKARIRFLFIYFINIYTIKIFGHV